MSLDVYLLNNCCEHCNRNDEFYSANITHNLSGMAQKAGIYNIVWRPEEHGINYAYQLIEPLTKAIADMKQNPDKYEKYDAPNGWGTYEHFVPWLERYLNACEEDPLSRVRVSR